MNLNLTSFLPVLWFVCINFSWLRCSWLIQIKPDSIKRYLWINGIYARTPDINALIIEPIHEDHLLVHCSVSVVYQVTIEILVFIDARLNKHLVFVAIHIIIILSIGSDWWIKNHNKFLIAVVKLFSQSFQVIKEFCVHLEISTAFQVWKVKVDSFQRDICFFVLVNDVSNHRLRGVLLGSLLPPERPEWRKIDSTTDCVMVLLDYFLGGTVDKEVDI